MPAIITGSGRGLRAASHMPACLRKEHSRCHDAGVNKMEPVPNGWRLMLQADSKQVELRFEQRNP